MDTAIVIRDIHRYGDDLTVPEPITRLCDGGPVTVTVTDPAPPWPPLTPAARGSGSARGDHLYRVVQYYDSWPFQNDSRIPRGRTSHKRTETFRTLEPVRYRLARANGYAQHQRRNGGDWSAFVALAEELTDDGWQPIDVDFHCPQCGGINITARTICDRCRRGLPKCSCLDPDTRRCEKHALIGASATPHPPAMTGERQP